MAGRTRLENAFHESEELFRALMENVVDGLIIIDHEGVIQAYNRAAEEIFGFTADEVVGRNVSMLMPEPERSAHNSYIETYLRTGDAKIIGIGREVTGQRKDGEPFPMDLSIGEIPHHDAPFFVGVVRDLTDRKRREDLMRQANKLEALGQLTGGVAHDFNNLLAVLMMDLELLDSMVRDREEEAELVAEARQVAQAGADLTRRLLVFARNQPLEPKTTDIAGLISDLTTILRRTLGDNIEIDTVAPANLWQAEVDPGQLENALLNLALNARDALPSGGRLTITTSNVAVGDGQTWGVGGGLAPGDYVGIRVSDTGIGMPPEVLERALEPFFSTKEKEHGTGLGLSMVFGFARQSGGDVAIYSKEDQGTTVELILPRGDQRASGGDPERTRGGELPGGSETILLVEDHPQLRSRGVRTLGDLGYRVLAASDGDEALDVLARNGDVDLLFTDVVMPGGMTGPDLAQKVRADRPRVKVLFTTGYAEHSQLPRASDGGPAEILRKPYSRQKLATMIRDVLDRGDF